ncbi:hypothetical protein MMC21_008175 [Puttea exsequens]|nr:hypothetical protein [Puttea exsequens]
MARVPMRIRMDLRTHWETTDSAAQKSILALKSLIGLPVSVILDPSILWSELHSYYPDPAIFIPSIISLVQVWADVLAARLEDEGNAKWTDLLLTHLMQRGSDLRVRVEAGGGTLVSTSLTRRNSNCVFLLVIPKVVPPYRSAAAYFATDLLNIFDIGTSGKEDEEAPASPALSRVKARVSASSEMNLATELPCVETLPRPEILFAQQLPYHMLVSVADNKIAVQGSHQK